MKENNHWREGFKAVRDGKQTTGWIFRAFDEFYLLAVLTIGGSRKPASMKSPAKNLNQ